MGKYAHGVFAIKPKFILAGLVLVAAISTSFWFGRGLLNSETTVENRPNLENLSAKTVSRQAAGLALQDSDGDGLKDWEEALWRTDPQNPDTDGDGTPDGEEIAKSRNPLKKGPNDTLSSASPLVPSASTEDNLTFNLTKSLLESGVLGAVDQQGRITRTDFLEHLTIPQGIDPNRLLAPGQKITHRDLTLTSASDPETIRRYFNAVSEIEKKHLNPYQARGDLMILDEVVSQHDFSKLEGLDPIIGALDRTVGELRRLPVPAGYRDFAVRELNYLLATRRMVEIFRNSERDPIATALAVRPRLALAAEMANFHLEVTKGLRDRGLIPD